jgi:hypothetical protein
MEEDYTLEAMERRARIAKGGPLTNDERATIKAQSEKIAALEQTLRAAKEAEKIAAEKAEFTRIFEAMVKDLQSKDAEVPKLKLNAFWVGLFGIIAILILAALAAYGIFQLLKMVL